MSHRLRRVKPPIVRLVLLMTCALPSIVGMPHLERFAWASHNSELLLWAVYAVLIAALVHWELGVQTFRAIYSLACMSALLLLVAGGVIEYVMNAYHAHTAGEGIIAFSKGVVGVEYLWQFARVLTAIPLGLLIIGCFPPEESIRNALARGRITRARGRLLLWHRIVSHSLETTVELWGAWKEEMPALIKPLVSDAPEGLIEVDKSTIARLYHAVLGACSALLVGALEPIPLIDAEVEALVDAS